MGFWTVEGALVFRQATAPANPSTGDIWIDTDNGIMSTYNGSAWVEQSGGAQGAAFTNLSMNSAADALAYAASLQSLMTGTGDILQSSGANTPARLAIGTANQVVAVNSGATALEYQTHTQNTEIWSVLGDYEATSAESSHTFSFTAITFDDDSHLVLVIDGSCTLLLDLGVRVNAATTGYYGEGRRIVAGAEQLLDENDQTMAIVASDAMFGAVNQGATCIVKIMLSKSGNQDRPVMFAETFSSAISESEVTGWLQNTGTANITDIIVRTSTSTWQIGTRITLFRVRRAAV